MPSRLVLGCAQLGMTYGIKNTAGKPSFDRARGIVREAYECGLTEFDTAQVYGDSEDILGRSFVDLGIDHDVKVFTKLDPAVDYANCSALTDAVNGSRQRLRVARLHGLMLHREEMLDAWDRGIRETMDDLKAQGLIQKAGVSVYSPSRARQALTMEGIDVVQIPSSIVDQRFEKAGILALARQQNKEIYIRSVFIQGLLLMETDQIPSHLAFAKDTVAQVEALAFCHGLNREELCLGYVLAQWPQAKIIVGAESSEQIRRNARAAGRELSSDICREAQDMFDDVNERMVNPSLWTKQDKI